MQRIRAQGYKPATAGAHNRGDGVDLLHPKLSATQQAARLKELSKKYGWNATILDEGHHRHLAIPGWGAAPGTPGTPNSGLPQSSKGFDLVQRGSLSGGNFVAPTNAPSASPRPRSAPAVAGQPTGRVSDGDTFGLSSGNAARLFGVDAFEARQTGRSPSGAVVPLGINARNALAPFATPEGNVTSTNGLSYGRPVVTLNNGRDAGQSVLRQGWGLAAPNYLRGSPQFGPYMEAERLARANLLGAHGNTYQTPQSFRAGNPDPWEKPQAVAAGEKGVAVFAGEATPFMGLRPEIEAGYVALAQDPKTTAADLVTFARRNGFEIREEDAQGFIKRRNAGEIEVEPEIVYAKLPPPVTDLGHGAPGAFGRGVADPINFVDEIGAVAQTVGLPSLNGERENIWNSERRFGDILWNNIDQNRSILAYDDMAHPVARFGGQVASAVALPYGAGARTPMQLARLGAIEGGLAGAGAGEGGPIARTPSAILGTALGAGGGYALGHLAGALTPMVQRSVDAVRAGTGPPRAIEGFAPVVPAAETPTAAPRGSVAAMRMEDDGAELVGPVVPVERERDYLDLPPLPNGFALEEPFGAARRMDERLSAEEMARLAEDLDPRSVLPRPGNQVESLDEAMRANPGSVRELEAPNPRQELRVRQVPSGRDLFKGTRIRGPFDVTKQVRRWGGVKDQGGELTHLGITNAPRRGLEFGGNEQFLGKLVNNEDGLTLDEVGERLYDEGWLNERPTVAEVVDILHREHLGESLYHADDLNEVARFRDASAEADRIAKAADEGSPLAEEVGETITLDDLVENTPPAEAYEEMPRLTGKIGNINLAHLERPQDVAQLIQQVQSRVGGFSAASRGRVTNEETQRLANEIGVRPEDLLKRRQGHALNAEQLYATRVLVQKSREVVAGLARKAVGGSDEDVAQFRNAWLRHVALEEQVTGATSEAGRALQQFKMLARAGDARGHAVRAYLKGAGGRETIEQAAERIVDLMEDPAKASHFMREAVKPRWRDKINELWINSLLSGPKTHVVNFVGNAMTALMSLPEQGLTAGIGKVLRSSDRAYVGEVGARAVGMAESALDALRAAKRGFITGEPADAVSKVEAVNYHAIAGKLGQVIRTPTRALTAADEFWKTINSSAELRALAYRKAAQEGGDAEAVQARYEALLRAPSEEMTKQAQDAARYYTFQKELGRGGRNIQGFANETSGVKLILPFVRTPINLLKFAGERSIFAVAMPEVRQALRQGGRARDEALARITLGSGLSTAAVMAALDGRITGGGPTDPRERAALLKSGWQPYSVRIGDEWVSFQRFDPFSLLIGAAADFAELGAFAAPKERDDFAMTLGSAIAKNITSKTWLSGLSDFFEALSDPERFGKAWAQRLAGSAAVPSIAASGCPGNGSPHAGCSDHLRRGQGAHPLSPEACRCGGTFGVSRSSAATRWGRTSSRRSIQSNSVPIPCETRDWPPAVPLSMPQRFARIDGQRVDLTPEQYDELVQLSGRPAKAYLDQQVRSPECAQ